MLPPDRCRGHALADSRVRGNEPVVAAAYFDGDIASLKTAVDGKKGAGTWDRWLDLLDSSDFKGANALLKAEAAPKEGSPPTRKP